MPPSALPAAAAPAAAETYSLSDYDSDDSATFPNNPPYENLLSAAAYAVNLFEQQSGICYALMNGFAVSLLGGERERRGRRKVALCFKVEGGLREIWGMVGGEGRLVIPNTKKASGVLKVFVKTGEGYDQCKEPCRVELDLVEAGMLGSPRDLAAHRQTVLLNGDKKVFTLDILYMLRSMMAAFQQHEDDVEYADTSFILGKYEKEAKACRLDLYPDAVELFVERAPEGERARWADFFAELLADM